MHADEEYVYRALEAGASGYILKEADREELDLAIRSVMRGDVYLSPKTVETHRSDIMERLGIRDVAGLVRFAVRTGLIEPER